MSHFITQFCLECRIHQTRLATLWTDPNSVLPSLAGILNHWLKSELSVKNLPRLLQPLSPNDPFFHHSVFKTGPISSTGRDLLQYKCHFFKSLKDLQASKFCYIDKHAQYCSKTPSLKFSRERGHSWLAVCDMLQIFHNELSKGDQVCKMLHQTRNFNVTGARFASASDTTSPYLRRTHHFAAIEKSLKPDRKI